jgi:hypothetical protein
MKAIRLLPLLLAALFTLSCSSVRVNSDYDESANFTAYKTYGYLKGGVERVKISDLDKKRILTAIDAEMAKKGFTKSENPDFLVNIFTEANKEVNVNNYGWGGWGWGGWGWGGWGPGWGWGGNYVSTHTEGTLYIDVIDAAKKELVWQGVGTGVLTKNRDKKQELIDEFVQKIMEQFPPQEKK